MWRCVRPLSYWDLNSSMGEELFGQVSKHQHSTYCIYYSLICPLLACNHIQRLDLLECTSAYTEAQGNMWVSPRRLVSFKENLMVWTKEDISLQKHIGTPCPHQLRRLFPVCITVLWVLGSYTHRQLGTAVFSRQSTGTGSYTDRGKSSQLMTKGREVELCFYL